MKGVVDLKFRDMTQERNNTRDRGDYIYRSLPKGRHPVAKCRVSEISYLVA